MDNALFNKNVELLRERFRKFYIPLEAAADFYGCDKRTLEAAKDFPLSTIGNRKGVNLTAFAEWLTKGGAK